jgi:hypothetical protein
LQATITPKTEDFEKDQIEESTNTMIYLLFRIVCRSLLNSMELPGMDFAVTQDTNKLSISVGGFFLTTKPDLKKIY